MITIGCVNRTPFGVEKIFAVVPWFVVRRILRIVSVRIKSLSPPLRPNLPHSGLLLDLRQHQKTSHQPRMTAASPQEQLGRRSRQIPS